MTASTQVIDMAGKARHWQVATAVMVIWWHVEGFQKRKGDDGMVAAVPTTKLEARGQRSPAWFPRVRKSKENPAYQQAWECVVWAAYLPQNVGPLGVHKYG